MKKYPKIIQDLIEIFNDFPGIGPKTSERFVFWLLSQNNAFIQKFLISLKGLKTGIKVCSVCHNYSESDPCDICSNKKRNSKQICIVGYPQEMALIEATNEYTGRYFILGGYLNPLEGINPENLRIKEFLSAIGKNLPDEIILGFSPTIEGEATIAYLKNLLKDSKIKITRLAQGLPIGASLEYTDQITIINALNQRKELK